MTESFGKNMAFCMEELNLPASGEVMESLYVYYRMLVEKNRVMNLTAITQEQDVIIKHFADSLEICRAADLKSFGNLIDVGTGAGFPGLVLKIVFPELKVTLTDSLNKRLLFLNEVIDKLGLKGVETVHGRAEDLGRDKRYREKYDIAVSRAVAGLPVLLEYSLPFVRMGGVFGAYKSGNYQEELEASKNALKALGGANYKNTSFNLPGTGIERALLLIRKEKPTPLKYPRKAGTPSAKPL